MDHHRRDYLRGTKDVIKKTTSRFSAADLEAQSEKCQRFLSQCGYKSPDLREPYVYTPNDYPSPQLMKYLSDKGKVPQHFLFPFACGYALFKAIGGNELDFFHFESAEKYINRSDQIFSLTAYLPFSSREDALVQMEAINESTVTDELKEFLESSLPKPTTINGRANYHVAVSNPLLGQNIVFKTGMSHRGGKLCCNVVRGLRMKIHTLIDGLELEDLEKAQLDLARQWYTRACIGSSMAVSSSTVQKVQNVMVVPHRFNGVFIAKDKEDFICTKSLVPGEALDGEEILYVQNEDGIEVEYRVWNTLSSKLGAAIRCGVTSIWVEPSSRVLYLGKCGITVSHLSDLVGSDGLVNAVGFSDVVNMAQNRSNVVPIFEDCEYHWKYSMVVGMVDVIVADIVDPHQVRSVDNNAKYYLRAGGHYMISTLVNSVDNNAKSYLRAGGHYMISTLANNIDSPSQPKDPFADHDRGREFKPVELVMLDTVGSAMAVGAFRILDD